MKEAELSDDFESLRMMMKVAHLYHSKSMVQTEIARNLGLSQARVSRLLSAAEAKGIVRRVVIPPHGFFSELERALENAYGLSQVHVVDGNGDSDDQLTDSLGTALSSIFQVMPIEDKVIGFTSWSRSLRSFVSSLDAASRAQAKTVVEMLGGVGDPALQHQATKATERLAKLTGAVPMFLRVPGVVSSPIMKQALLEHDSHAQSALDTLDYLNIALVGIGASYPSEHVRNGPNFYSDDQFREARDAGAVGEINLRFIDINGNKLGMDFESNVIGIELDQLRRVPVKIGVSGGPLKRDATVAACRGGWINILVTDSDTAEYMLAKGKNT